MGFAAARVRDQTQALDEVDRFDPEAHRTIELPQPISRRRQVFKHHRLMHHNRLAAALVALNLAVAFYGIASGGWFTTEGIALGSVANAAILNITLAILIRQQYVVNLLFRIATAAPTSWPLRIRWTLGKVYHFGGIHIGGAISGTVWFAVLLGSIAYHAARGLPGTTTSLVVVSTLLLGLLLALVLFSLPSRRAKNHDRFEAVHRFGGWAALGLFWVHSILLVNINRIQGSLVSNLANSLTFWLLIAVSISIALPWLRLRRVPIQIERPSDHVAVVRFNHGVTPFAGSSTSVSRNPLMEWHAFANVPSPSEDGFRLTISRAGDWTGDLIDDQPSHLWVKGIPTAGVGNIDKLFKKVIWVATGSGVGPTLPHLLARTAPAHLIWATRNPRTTYGDALVDEILESQPDATIWNTDTYGKPDMVRLTYQAVIEHGAEAVICISNKKLTWQVVEGMEKLGIPAYGAIWDS